MTPKYSIYSFSWYKNLNMFICENPIEGIHPTTKKEFYIINDDTGGFRRFRYLKTSNISHFNISEKYAQFESEDGISCAIKIPE